ncbi:unnamed protein product [Symbiodinium sp. CCMP2592]|nr:unnamed protein product [Symbiodinium sp. CCMP2592]
MKLLDVISFSFSVVFGYQCLPNGFPEEDRLYVLNSSSQMSPIQVASLQWRSAMSISLVAEILISEMLGYHALVSEVLYASDEAILRLVGCWSPDCSIQGPMADVLLSFWLYHDMPLFQRLQKENPRPPEDLGSMGYVASDGMYIKGSVLNRAASDGLSLEFFKSYNLSFHQPYRYFDTVWALPEAEILKCDETFNGAELDTVKSDLMKNYLDKTGDAEGVIEKNGRYLANCSLPAFWIAPACRHNYTLCIPLLQLGPGMMPVYMQWSVAYGLPLALTHARDFTPMTQLIRSLSVLYYWWEPDETLVDLQQAKVILPPHSPKAWSQGDFRTASTDVYVAKLGSQNLRTAAPRVRMFLQNLALEASEALELTQSIGFESDVDDRLASLRQGACEWIRSHSHIWEQWMPVATDCTPGFGLVDAQGLPVTSLDEAVECRACPAGRFSERFTHDSGLTFRCQLCDPGYRQSRFGQSSCIACDPGTYAEVAGQATCSPCARGRFANSNAATACLPCGPEEVWTTSKAVDYGGHERWIEVEGATSASSCRCVQGRYLSPMGQCEICIEGSSCPGSGVLTLLPGFYSTQGNPGAVMRCFGSALRCPGGFPETCANGGDFFALAVLAGLILLGTATLHLMLAASTSSASSASHRGALLGAALCVNQLITCSQIFGVLEQIQGIVWAEPFLSFLQFFRVLSLEALLSSAKTLSCVTRIGPEMAFVIRTLIVPACFTLGPFLVQLVMRAIWRPAQTIDLVKTLGFLFLLFFISLCSSFVEPFRCNLHPNGSLTMQTAHDVFCSLTGTHLTLCWMSAIVCLLPIGFLTTCTWVLLVVLPKRLKAADATFVRACSFLILRFKPGSEVFTLVFLLRNVLLVLTPMMQPAISLFVMGNLLAWTAASVAYFKPWRTDLSNQMDVFVSSILLSVLLMGALTVSDAEAKGLMILCTVCGLVIVTALTTGTLCLIVQHIASKCRKKFAYFLSHHRSASAAYARLLRMELRSRGKQFNAFIDSDNLTDLSRLFSYVINDTQTFVILATPEILKRKWCMGEAVGAKLAEVDTMLITFPGFELPDEVFIRNYARIVPDIKELAAYGIGLSDVRDTLCWLSTVRSCGVASPFSMENFSDVVHNLTGLSARAPKHQPSATDYAILADPENMEAMATAQVLGRFLIAIVPERGLSTHVLCSKENALYDTRDDQSDDEFFDRTAVQKASTPKVEEAEPADGSCGRLAPI